MPPLVTPPALSLRQKQARFAVMAAQLILQGYLDAGCPPEGTVVDGEPGA